MKSLQEQMKLKNHHGKLTLGLLFMLTLFTGTVHNGASIARAASGSSLVIVAGSDFNISRLSKSEVEAIFLQKRVSGPGQQILVPIFLPDSSDSSVEFADRVLGKSVKQLRAYWNLKVLTGRLKPPIVVETPEELITYLNRNHGSLGYLYESDVRDGLRVLYREE